MEYAYAAIGRAVAFAQIFETALIPIFEFFKMQTDPGYLERTGGCVSAGAFKVPVKNIIKALSAKGDIAPDLEARLNAYVEDRHTLIHRYFQENGWPAENDEEGFAPIITLANRVESEAKELARFFTGYMVRHMFPDENTSAEYIKAKMAIIFQRANVDE